MLFAVLAFAIAEDASASVAHHAVVPETAPFDELSTNNQVAPDKVTDGSEVQLYNEDNEAEFIETDRFFPRLHRLVRRLVNTCGTGSGRCSRVTCTKEGCGKYRAVVGNDCWLKTIYGNDFSRYENIMK